MNQQEVLVLFGVLLTALGTLVVALAKIFWSKLAALDSNALTAFIAMDTEREKQACRWRTGVEKRLDEKRTTLKDHEHRITRLERNGHG